MFNKKYFVAGFLVVALAVGIYAYKEYNRKPANLSTLKAQFDLKAEKLVSDFMVDEAAANKLYLGKIINVFGNVLEVQNQNDTLFTLLLGDTLQISKVSCLIEISNIATAKKYKIGDALHIKGICTGYLMDVELNRCVIVEK